VTQTFGSRGPSSPCPPLGPRPAHRFSGDHPAVRKKPATTATPASLAVATSRPVLAIPVLSQNPSTPVSARRLHRKPLRCVPRTHPCQHGIAPTPTKAESCPPPMAPQTPLGCTHSGGAPAPKAHISLLYGYGRYPVLFLNPTTPVSAHRLHQTPPRCVTRYSPFGQPGLAPTTPQKQIPEPPPTAPQRPLRCTHSGGAPAPTAHMSLLYRYLLFSQTVWHSLRIHLEQCVAHPSVSYVPLDAPVAPHA
jgi:hypothetical protein